MRRRRSSGQGLVEFAIVGGLLFFLIFSVMNAGFYLYGANAMQYAADIGTATIAAEGNYDNTGIPAPNNADNLRAWIQNPATFKPGVLMPAMNLTDKELSAVTAYMQSLR